jgi:hypothetical protein
MKVGRLKPRAFTSYFLTSGHRRGLVVLIKNFVLQGLVVFQGRRHTSSMSRS